MYTLKRIEFSQNMPLFIASHSTKMHQLVLRSICRIWRAWQKYEGWIYRDHLGAMYFFVTGGENTRVCIFWWENNSRFFIPQQGGERRVRSPNIHPNNGEVLDCLAMVWGEDKIFTGRFMQDHNVTTYVSILHHGGTNIPLLSTLLTLIVSAIDLRSNQYQIICNGSIRVKHTIYHWKKLVC